MRIQEQEPSDGFSMKQMRDINAIMEVIEEDIQNSERSALNIQESENSVEPLKGKKFEMNQSVITKNTKRRNN